MGLRAVLGDVTLPSAARGAGTYVSGPVANAGMAADVVVTVHATASSGTPTLNTSVEESTDGVSWSAVAGSSTPQLAAAGNAVGACSLSKNFVRTTSVVAGTTPNVTFRVVMYILAE